MLRYHKDVYFPTEALQRLEALTQSLNAKDWSYTKHCIDNLKHRVIDCKDILSYIASLKLDSKNIFEFYEYSNIIDKICYRIPYNNKDIILVLNKYKGIITIYLNDKMDCHNTLKKELYCTA